MITRLGNDVTNLVCDVVIIKNPRIHWGTSQDSLGHILGFTGANQTRAMLINANTPVAFTLISRQW